MTDNEIVKALECCMGCACKECSYHNEADVADVSCKDRLVIDALKLINRQKAEIETWKKNCDDLYEEMSERQKAEVEIAKRMGKSKAIKEFAERLKESAIDADVYSGYRKELFEKAVTVIEIDRILEEMTEEI